MAGFESLGRRCLAEKGRDRYYIRIFFFFFSFKRITVQNTRRDPLSCVCTIRDLLMGARTRGRERFKCEEI